MGGPGHARRRNLKRWGLVLLIGAAGLAWLFNVSRPGLRPAGCLQACAPPPPAGAAAEPLTIVTWNMLHGFPDFSDLPQRLDLIAGALREHEADVILLQEVPQTLRTGNAAAYLAEQLGMNYVYARANGNARAIFFEEGAAILSRFPLAEPRVWELAPQAGFFEHRIALSAGVLAPHGRVTVYATHLTHGEAATNQAQAAHLASIVSQTCAGVCVIGGDFNAAPGSPQIVSLQSEWVDSFAAGAPGAPGYTCCLEDRGAPASPQLAERIDFLFLAAGDPARAEILGVQTIPAEAGQPGGRPGPWPSDHLGVLAVVLLR